MEPVSWSSSILDFANRSSLWNTFVDTPSPCDTEFSWYCYKIRFSPLLLIISILSILYRTVKNRFLHLGDIPGPFWAPWTRLWLAFALASGDAPNRYIDVNRKYGMLKSYSLLLRYIQLPYVNQWANPPFNHRTSSTSWAEPFDHRWS